MFYSTVLLIVNRSFTVIASLALILLSFILIIFVSTSFIQLSHHSHHIVIFFKSFFINKFQN